MKVLALAVALCVFSSPAFAQGGGSYSQAEPGFPQPSLDMMEPGTVATARLPQLEYVSFKQKLNAQLPLATHFRDENGRDVTLGQYFNGTRPVVLAFVYYSCPMLCTQIMNGVSRAIKVLPFTPGQDFDIVFISFDPRDKPETAAAKKTALLNYWSAQNQSGAWHFLTGEEPEIRRVTSTAGFFYMWDERSQQYAHMSGVLVLTPDGRLSRYFYGVEYSPKELRLALVESGQGHVGSVVDELLLYCYHYDPSQGRYGVIVMNLVRLGGVLTVLAIGGFILAMRRQERQHMEGHA
ncbi:MAG: SCO family protein [Acidobacteria bacterium]|nr:MAG: SCO family protein [Acidobacteriota bacterium]